MASPVVAATNTSFDSTAGTTHVVNLPASIAAGNILVIAFGWEGLLGVTTPSGWTLEASNTIEAGVDDGGLAIFSKTASGSEGATVTITTAGSIRSVHHSYRLTGGDAVQAAIAKLATGVAANPPNLAPAWGTADITIIAAAHVINEAGAISALPTNYTNSLANQSSHSEMASGRRSLTAASSEDPGAFSWTGGGPGWLAATIIVQGVASGVDFSGTLAAAVSDLDAVLAINQELSGALSSASSTMAGVLNIIVGLSGSLISPSGSLSGQASVIGGISGALVSPSAALIGNTSIIGGFLGALEVTASTISGAFETSDDLTFSSTLAAGTSTLTTELSVLQDIFGTLAANSSIITAALAVNVDVAGVLNSAAASLSGIATIIAGISGSLASGSSTIVGTQSTIGGFTGALASAASAISGNLFVTERSFAGALVSQVSVLAAVMSVLAGFSGNLPSARSTIASTMTLSVSLTGVLAAQSAQFVSEFHPIAAFSGPLISGVSTIISEAFTGIMPVFTGALLAQPAIISGILSPVISLEGKLWARPTRLELEWIIRLPHTGTGWRRDRASWVMSIGKRR